MACVGWRVDCLANAKGFLGRVHRILVTGHDNSLYAKYSVHHIVISPGIGRGYVRAISGGVCAVLLTLRVSRIRPGTRLQ